MVKLSRVLILSICPMALLTAFVFPISIKKSSVSIETTKTRAPISKYIFGQFLEHWGGAVYRGSWAEMLEDRKFFYPVTSENSGWEMFTPSMDKKEGQGHPYEVLMRSPWMIIGDRSAVTMMEGNKTLAWPRENRSPAMNSYVGVHTPQILLPGDGVPGGIYQDRLALVDGKTYSGRIVVAGNPGSVPIEVSLVWGVDSKHRDTVIINEISSIYTTVQLQFTARQTTDNARLEIIGKGKGHFLIGTVSLMPTDNIHGWRADTVAMLKELNSPIYRWPGGSFVSGYNWKEGIGDRDRRAPRKNNTWKGIESNDVGIHEFLALCREINAEPFIVVNTGSAGAQLAAEQVEYVNGGPNTPMGQLRSKNGHPEAFGVKWWQVGNEIFDQPIEEYVKKHNRSEAAMRAVDPLLQTVAVGELGWFGWSKQMMTHCSNHMDFIAEHKYWEDEKEVKSHVEQVPFSIKSYADQHRNFRKEVNSLQDKKIPIAMVEWNYWYGPNRYGEGGVRFSLQDGLGIAAGLHEFFRNSDIYFMANYAQAVNVLGAIKTTKTEAEFEPTGLVLKLYRQNFGTIPVEVSGNYAPLDIEAAWTENKASVTVGVVNPTQESHVLSLGLIGSERTENGHQWTITGSNRWAHNAPGESRQVDVKATSFSSSLNEVEIPSLSVTLLSLPVE